MKKLLFMIPNLGHGGAEKVLVNLVNNMNKKKFHITVMTLYNEGINKQFLNENIVYKSCMKKSFPGMGHILKIFSPKWLYCFFIREKYDVVISYLEGQTARIISGCPDRDTKKLCWVHRTLTTAKDSARLFRNEKEAQKCYEQFDNIISVSQDVQKAFMDIYPIHSKGIILYNTNLSEEIKRLSCDSIREDIVFKDDEIKLCAMGSLIPVKGYERLIKIHAQLIREGYKIHTYILGEGNLKDDLSKLIVQLEIQNSITLLGYQTNPYKYLVKCDLFVCSSYSEGFSTAVTEALILGLPVITTEVSGMRELLGEDNRYGLIVGNNENELYVGIKKMLDHPQTLSYYHLQSVKRGQKFSMHETINKIEKLLLSI